MASYCMHPRLRALSILTIASILVAGLPEEPPSPYRIDLIHVDANGGFTRDELIRRAAHRTHLRAATLSATDSSATHLAGVDYSDLEYLVDLEIGTWPEAKPFRAVLDTGSSIVLVTKLNLCNLNSSSFASVSCSDDDGAQAESMSCWEGLSMFRNTYGGKKTAKGFMGKETLTLISATTRDSFPGVLVGCAFNIDCDEGVPDRRRVPHCSMALKDAAGILGLDRGPRSLLNQFKPRKFSYCLNDQTKPDLKSQLLLGNVPDLTTTGSEPVQKTKLIDGENKNKYYVQLEEISIGESTTSEGEKIPIGEPGKGMPMMVDSGSSYTSLAKGKVFEDVKEYVAKLFPDKPIRDTKDLVCFKDEPKSRPEMKLRFLKDDTMHLKEATMHLPWNQYMVQHTKGWCLAVKENNRNKYILGNFQQQNKTMLFDLEEDVLSFVPADCTQQKPRDMHTCM